MQVAAYCRVSTESEDQAQSFAAQKSFFREYIAGQPDWSLYEIYADRGLSGTTAQCRPAFQRMLEDARSGAFSLILSKEVSRFSRNLLDTIQYTRELKSLGVEVIFLTDGIRSTDPDAELRLSIMASIAQEESRRISQRVAWGQQRRMEMGVVFGPPPLGYRMEGGRMAVDDEGARLVRRIFELYTLGQKSCREIAAILTAEEGRCWRAGTVNKMLHNEKYAGDLVQRKSYTPDYLSHKKHPNRGAVPLICQQNHHEAIISRELWEETQQRLCRGRKDGAARSLHYAFSGRIRCGRCGAVFTAKKKSQYLYWHCSCGIGCMLRDDDAFRMVGQALESLEAEPVTAEGDDPTILQKQLQKIAQKERRMLDCYFSGGISADECRAFREDFNRQRRQLERTADSCAWPELTPAELWADGSRRELMVRNLTDSITVFEDRHLELRFIGLPQTFRYEYK